MTEYWSLSVPHGNIEITVLSKLIKGKSAKANEHFFKKRLQRLR
jgi:hypothetical protein